MTKIPCGPVSWGYRICQMHLCREVRLSPNQCPGFNTKPSGGEASVLKFWVKQSNPSLPLFPGPL